MNPFPEPYSILILDNASIHKGQYIFNLYEQKGIHLIFLPAYSPDFNLVFLIILFNINFDYIINSLSILLIFFRSSNLFFTLKTF